jgi:hypothetical protein
VGTQRGIVVSEGGPRPSKVFVHDDPRLCAALLWWGELARASGALFLPFAGIGAVAAWLCHATASAYVGWLAAAPACAVGLHLLRRARLRRRVVYRAAAADAELAPAVRLSRLRLAAAFLTRMWPAVAVVVLFSGDHGGTRFLTALAWAPAMVAAWTATAAVLVMAATTSWERKRGLRLLFPAGVRQRAAEPYVLYTAPR